MADISLVIDVKQNGVTSAVKNTKTLESNVKLLSTSYKNGSLSQRQYYKGLLELARATGKSEAELRRYANELRRIDRASAAATRAARAEAQAVREYAAARRQANEENRRRIAAERASAQAAQDAIRAARSQADANRRLRMEFREGYAAQVALRAAQMRLSQAHRQGIIDAEEYQRQLQRLGQSAQQGGRHMSRAGVMTQQFGYQAGDFLVQIQGGTNAMVAFGQQATQLVGALYMLPAATIAARVGILGLQVSVGALIATAGILIPLLTAIGAYFMRTRGTAKTFSQTLDELTSAISNYKSSLDEAGKSTNEMSVRFGNLSEDMRPFLEDLKDLEMVKSVNLLSEQFSKLEANSAGFFQRYAATMTGGASLQAELAKELGVTIEAYEDITDLVSELKAAETSQDRINTAIALRNLIRDSTGNVDNMTQEMRDFYQNLVETVVAGGELQSLMDGTASGVDQASYNSEVLADQLSMVRDMIVEASREAETLAARLLSSARAFMAVTFRAREARVKAAADAATGVGYGGRGSSPGAGSTPGERALLGMGGEDLGSTDIATGGGGRSSAQSQAQAYKDNLDIYKESLKEVLELEEERRKLTESITTSFTDGLTSIVDGTKSVKDAFRDMARAVIKQLWDVYVVQQIVGGIGNIFAGGATTGMNSVPSVNPLAGLSGSQMLPSFAGGGYTGDGSRSGGMDGQGGYLAMLHPRETVTDHTKSQSAGDTIVINQSFSFSANGDESVKRIIAEAAPQIANMTQQKMMDQRRRGGAVKATFG